MFYPSHRLGLSTFLLCSLLWPGCQSRLHMEEASPPTAKMMVDAGTQTPAWEVSLTSASTGKRAASELSQPDTEEKKESPVAGVWRQPLTDTRVLSREGADAAMAQESQESGTASAIVASRDLAVTTLAKTAHQDTVPTAKADRKQEGGAAPQATPTGLTRWFQEFADAVDGVVADGEPDDDPSVWISSLIKEGKDKGYLTQSARVVISEVGWEPNCTPLHYAAAKGNVHAVAALLREPSVVIDAKTEDEYGSTPLHFAAYEGSLGAAQLLVEGYKKRGKLHEIDAHDDEGSSPLQYAAGGPWDGMNEGVAELLVANGADLMQCCGTENDITLGDLSAINGNHAMSEYWVGEIAYAKILPKEEKRKLVKSAMRLAKRHKHTDIVITLEGYYKRMCAHDEST
jgi:Ankyrin repeats (3 copies)